MKHAPAVLLLGLAVAGCTEVAAPPSSPALAGTRAHHSVVTPGGVIYTASSLGSLGGQYGSALMINDNGQVAGISYYGGASFYYHAFRWQAGVMTELHPVGGHYSSPAGMNSSGVVAGMTTVVNDNLQHAALWNGTTITDLGTLPGHEFSFAQAINDQGVVTGGSYNDGDAQAFSWQNGVMTALPGLGGTITTPYAINNQGDIIGASYLPGNITQHAVLWRNGVAVDLTASLGAASHGSYAVDINDAGQVVGTFWDAFFISHAFRWENGVLTDLGTLNGSAWTPTAINNHGDVVGRTVLVGFPPFGNSRAVLWHAGTLTDLGTLGGDAASASDINDAGQIVGTDNTAAGFPFQRAFLWENGVMTDLGTLGGNSSSAFTKASINNHGQIVGTSEEADFVTSSPTLWNPSLPVITVTVDIKPGSTPNPVNPKSKGVIPVAVLSLNGFDATKIDALSVRFGPGQAAGNARIEDVNGDGVPDMLLHFDTQASGIACGATSATLTGQTTGGQKISGSDAVVTVGCK